jgi:hypothetical protein
MHLAMPEGVVSVKGNHIQCHLNFLVQICDKSDYNGWGFSKSNEESFVSLVFSVARPPNELKKAMLRFVNTYLEDKSL